MKTNPVLFVGNGINNVNNENKLSWKSILNKLKKEYKLDIKDNPEKPFPLLFEQIISDILRSGGREFEAKEFIGGLMKNLSPEKLHKEIVSMGFKNIITSNYDLTLEKSLIDSIKHKNQGVIKETRQNLFRKYTIEDCNFWHMHGTILAPDTIALGYEHYTAYLHKMREYILSGGEYTSIKFESIRKRLMNNSMKTVDSWVDLFFTHDIYFLGFGLDFTEITMWFLLNERFRMKYCKCKGKINNNIYYFHSKEDFNSNTANGKNNNRTIAKLELLEANDVKLVEINNRYDEKYYYKCLSKIKNSK